MGGPVAPLPRRALLAGPAALAFPRPALSQNRVRWRMVTSWPKHLPGPGLAAALIARRVGELSDGLFEIQHFAGGEIVPALQVFDPVSTGTVEMGHTASFFWIGKIPAAAWFTTLPFGPGPVEHQAWIERFGGQALWDELYRPFNVRAVLAGNTGPSMGGWFRRPLESAADAKGLRIRVQGLGGEVWQRLGATPLAIAPADILTSLSSGALDAVEFLAPVNDRPLGLVRAAPFYYLPGFNKPNGAAEALFNLDAFAALPAPYRAMLLTACAEAHGAGLGEAEADNAAALVALIAEGAQLRRFPTDLLAAARLAAQEVVAGLAASSPLAGRIHASYEAARSAMRAWRRVQTAAAAALGEA